VSVTPGERRVIEAAKRCCERWGFAKVTVDDIAIEAGVSRATLYRLFPGGKDVLFEAMRVLELEEFFASLRASLEGAADVEELLTRAVVESLRLMHDDEHLALLLAAAPGETIGQLTVDGLPRIIRVATVFLTPLLSAHLDDRDIAVRVVELLVRLVISEFLAPSEHLDLTDEQVTRSFLRAFVLPGLSASTLHSTR
jgi:AcrR family transcriptional regulator